MSNRLLTNAAQNSTGSVELDTAHNLNLQYSPLRSIYTWGTLGAGAVVHVDALESIDGEWISAAQISSSNFNTVVALQVRAVALRGRVVGGDGTTSVNLKVL